MSPQLAKVIPLRVTDRESVEQLLGRQTPYKLFPAGQRKYDIDANSPWWKRVLFRRVYAPFVEFFFTRLNFVPWDRRDADGSYSWLEWQGIYSQEWQAEQEAARYPFGLTLQVPFNESLPAESVHVPQKHPGASQGIYEQVGRQTVPIEVNALNRLQIKLAESDELVSLYKTRTV